MQKQLQSTLQKEMSRKELLMTLGFGAASLFGFSSLVKMLNGHQQRTIGYGSSAYGGNHHIS